VRRPRAELLAGPGPPRTPEIERPGPADWTLGGDTGQRSWLACPAACQRGSGPGSASGYQLAHPPRGRRALPVSAGPGPADSDPTPGHNPGLQERGHLTSLACDSDLERAECSRHVSSERIGTAPPGLNRRNQRQQPSWLLVETPSSKAEVRRPASARGVATMALPRQPV
jgi:hypothetical protein